MGKKIIILIQGLGKGLQYSQQCTLIFGGQTRQKEGRNQKPYTKGNENPAATRAGGGDGCEKPWQRKVSAKPSRHAVRQVNTMGGGDNSVATVHMDAGSHAVS